MVSNQRYFFIDQDLKIKTKQPLDYEFRQTYYIEVACFDKNAPLNAIKDTFKITVTSRVNLLRNAQVVL